MTYGIRSNRSPADPFQTYAYKLGFDGSGRPLFTFAGQSAETSAGRVGVGVPTVTTDQGRPGSGILWMTVSVVPLMASLLADKVTRILTLDCVPGMLSLGQMASSSPSRCRRSTGSTSSNGPCSGMPGCMLPTPMECSTVWGHLSTFP